MARCSFVVAMVIAGSFWSVPGAADTASSAPLELAVHVAPDPASDGTNLKVNLDIRNHRGQGVQLAWPLDFFHIDMQTFIRNPRVEGVEDNDIRFVTRSNRFISSLLVPAEPDGAITVQYDLDPSGLEGDRAWHPTVEQDHLHFMGHAVLPSLCLESERDAACDEQRIIDARFDWSAFDGRAWSTWSPNGTDASYHGPMLGLLEAIYAAGSFDQRPISVVADNVPDLQVTLVTRDVPPDVVQEAAAVVNDAMAGVLAFWRERPADHVLVTLRTISGDRNNEKHSGFDADDSFAMMIEADDPIDSPGFKALVAHEFTHLWIDAELFANPRGKRMFHEGFTDFVANQVIWRRGLMSFDDYRDYINDVLRRYFSSWLHDAPEADLVEFDGTGVSYQRGELLALSWAHELAHRVEKNAGMVTKDAFETFDLPIDRFIRSVIATTEGDGTLHLENTFAIADAFGLTDMQEDIEALSEGDGTIDVANWFGPCTELTSVKVERPDIGLNIFESFRRGIIVELDPDGPAAKAGLQEGDQVRHLSFSGLRQSHWEIEREGKQLNFTYPNKAKTIIVPQFQRKSGVAQDDLCLGTAG